MLEKTSGNKGDCKYSKVFAIEGNMGKDEDEFPEN